MSDLESQYHQYWRPGTLFANYIYYKMWNDITYPFPNLNGAMTEVWEWTSNFIPQFTGHDGASD